MAIIFVAFFARRQQKSYNNNNNNTTESGTRGRAQFGVWLVECARGVVVMVVG